MINSVDDPDPVPIGRISTAPSASRTDRNRKDARTADMKCPHVGNRCCGIGDRARATAARSTTDRDDKSGSGR